MSSIYKKRNVWYYAIYLNGHQKSLSLGVSNKNHAQKLKADLDYKYAREKFGLRNIESVRISAYLLDFLRTISATKSAASYKRIKSYIHNLTAYFQDRPEIWIHDITASTVKDFILSRISADRSPKTIREEIDIFRRILDEAVTDNYLEKNTIDFKTLKSRHIPRKETNHYPPFTKAQAQVIFDHPSMSKYADYFKILYYTGMRTIDVGRLRSGEVVTLNKIPCIAKITAKEKVPVTVPLHKNISFLLRRPADPWYFPDLITESNRHQAYKALKTVTIAKKWDSRLCQHSFRHAFSQRLLELNMTDQARQALLGHLSSVSTQAYSHPDLALAKTFIDKL